ncbi:hypothetical protein G6F37_000068 [Rhizopus arrhizus]|nr:hypothetical protein G6F38_000033 [Rhizopus arrhizus]KAG1164679.1 hypothetical protein G6F37_000068 [Rhizopus arrhizus]
MALINGAGSHEMMMTDKRHSRSLDLEQTNTRHIYHLHRSASENDGVTMDDDKDNHNDGSGNNNSSESSSISQGTNSRYSEKQVPSKVFSLYKKFSTRRTSQQKTTSFLPEIKTNDRFKKSRTSFSSALSNFLPSNNNIKQQSIYQIEQDEKRYKANINKHLLVQTGESKRSLPNTLQNDITQFAIDGYAKKYFATHKKGLFKRTVVPMNEMLQWTKDSIRQPLLISNKNKTDALKCFKILQILMHDRPKPKNYDCMENFQYLLGCGITKGQMRDEIYVQICRQLNNNPKRQSIRKGWEILSVVCLTFPPSKDLESYLYDFVKRYHSVKENQLDVFSSYVTSKLERICSKGARGKVLSIAEIERAMEAPFKPSVFGESLETIMKIEKNSGCKIPKIVLFLTNAVHELDGKRTEGIFRVPGDADSVTDLRVRIEKGMYDLSGIDDPNVPASLLKYWLRDLLEPLIPKSLYQKCIESANDSYKAVAIINSLPDCNRRIILYIIQFLQGFTEPSVIECTRMNIFNLAMVFAPNFLRCPFTHLPTVFENSKHEQTFVKTLITVLYVDKEACANQEGEIIGTTRPEGCDERSTIYSNVTKVGIESDAYGVVPFLELLDVEKYIVNTPNASIFSPCVTDTHSNSNSTTADFVFSSEMPLAAGNYVSFSAHQDTLTPLQRASWLLYVAAFFDQEVLASTIYSYISNKKALAWTEYRPEQGSYVIYRDPYYSQLVSDAGGRLIAPNSAQDTTFTVSDQKQAFYFTNDLQGADVILDISAANLTFQDWVQPIQSSPAYSIKKVPAIEQGKVYSVNGLVNKNNISDWNQRAAARPDMVLLDIIHLLYPTTFNLPTNNYPVWISPYSNTNGTSFQHPVSHYGNCENMASSAFEDTVCSFSGYAGSIQDKPNLSAGDKAGISMGAIFGFIGACVVVYWLYKRYRQQRKRHQFYKLDEF